MMVQLSFIRPGSNLHRANVELYQRHHQLSDGSGRCATCGDRTPCPARRHAALVIRDAGEDPRWYDGQLPSSQRPASLASAPTGTWQPAPLPVAHHLTLDTPGVTGYALGGHGRRAEVPYFEYER